MVEEKQQQSPVATTGEARSRPPIPTSNGEALSGGKPHFPNPPDPFNPDPATLRDQWRYAIRQYSRWYSQAWGMAIFAGVSFFALGWFIKGYNPLPSRAGEGNKGAEDPASPAANRQ